MRLSEEEETEKMVRKYSITIFTRSLLQKQGNGHGKVDDDGDI